MPAGERVVVDTNTIVSGILLPRSVPGRLLDLLVGAATLIFSPATRDELLGVVARAKFDRYVSAEARERAAVILVRDGEGVTETFCSCLPRPQRRQIPRCRPCRQGRLPDFG